jgi:hypothetical protein
MIAHGKATSEEISEFRKQSELLLQLVDDLRVVIVPKEAPAVKKRRRSERDA